MMKKRSILFLLACLLLTILTTVHADSATLYFSRDSLTMSVGRYVTVYVWVTPSGTMSNAATLSSSDESVATVDSDGKVRAVGVGDCIITAVSKVDETITATMTVTVVVPVEDVDLTYESTGVVIGSTLQLTASCVPADATLQGITFSSSDETIATVSQDGLVTGLKKGTVTIKATSEDEKAYASVRITVKQPPESVTISPETLTLAEGKTKRLTATVLPKNTDDKSVIWTSADESVATVSENGTVTAVELGETVITATCVDNENATYSIPVTVLKLATSVSFDQDEYEVTIGETIQLSHTVYPANTSDQSVTYSSSNSRITVDENGVVTGVKGGTATVTIKTADGSGKTDKVKVTVVVPVTGVTYSRTGVRVGEGNYGHFTVSLEPSDATNTNMTWEVADESIATVSGDTTTFKIVGNQWGRTTVTGTTEDGGYSITLDVNIGSLNSAVTVSSLSIYYGKPYITLTNNSDMIITQVSYFMQGLDSNQQPIEMSTTGDTLTLYGTYDYAMYPGESSQHGIFTFYSPSDYPDLTYLFIVITGWTTSTGYYNNYDDVLYTYYIPEDYQVIVIYPSDADPALFQSNG